MFVDSEYNKYNISRSDIALDNEDINLLKPLLKVLKVNITERDSVSKMALMMIQKLYIMDMRTIFLILLSENIVQSKICEADKFSIIHESSRIKTYMSGIKSNSITNCVIRCKYTKNCKSVNYNYGTTECQLSKDILDSENLEIVEGWKHVEIYRPQPCDSNPCKFGGICEDICSFPGYKCKWTVMNFQRQTLSLPIKDVSLIDASHLDCMSVVQTDKKKLLIWLWYRCI